MKLMLKTVLLIICCAGLVSCAYTPQTARLEPNVNIATSSEGKGATVSVKVVDERPEDTIGHRGAAALFKGAEISLNQDLEKLFQTEIYYTSTGFWTGGVHTKAAVKAMANVEGDSYENFYRVENEKRVVIVPTAEANEKLINEILNDILKKLFDDSELINFLAKT